MNFVKALNEIHPNVFGFVIICIGAACSFCSHADIGNSLIACGSVLLRQMDAGTTKVQ